MKTRTLIIIAGGILLIALIVAWLFFAMSNSSSNEDGPSTGGGGGLFDFLNFGNGSTPEQNNTENTENQNPTDIEVPVASTEKLRMLVQGPVSGAIATTTANGFSARFIDRATGHVKDVNIDTGEQVLVSNTTIPGIQEGYILAGGEEIILRYFDQNYELAETFGAKLVRNAGNASSTAPYATEGGYLSQNVESLAVSPTEAKIAYVETVTGGSVLYTAKTDDTVKATVFTSPVTEWLVQWPNATTILLATKPSARLPGYAYFVPARGGSLEKVMGAGFGLTALASPAASEVLFSTSANNTFGAALYFVSTKEYKEFPVRTLPEKCVWSKKTATRIYCGVPKSVPSALYPDTWYQGAVSFSDELWSINTADGTATLLSSPDSVTSTGIDATQLSLDKNETFLIFTNKKDGSLWALDLRDMTLE